MSTTPSPEARRREELIDIAVESIASFIKEFCPERRIEAAKALVRVVTACHEAKLEFNNSYTAHTPKP